MKIVKKKSNENCHFYSREKSLYTAWACFRNGMYKQDSNRTSGHDVLKLFHAQFT